MVHESFWLGKLARHLQDSLVRESHWDASGALYWFSSAHPYSYIILFHFKCPSIKSFIFSIFSLYLGFSSLLTFGALWVIYHCRLVHPKHNTESESVFKLNNVLVRYFWTGGLWDFYGNEYVRIHLFLFCPEGRKQDGGLKEVLNSSRYRSNNCFMCCNL